jgi:hypothetical protein
VRPGLDLAGLNRLADDLADEPEDEVTSVDR